MSVVVVLALVCAAPPSLKTANDVVARYDAIMSPNAFTATMAMTATREDGSKRTYVLKTQKQGTDKLRATFLDPANARGQEMLRVGDNLWSYVPNLKRTVRVASRDSFMGGDFNNGDVLRVNYTADYDAVLIDDVGDVLICATLTAKSNTIAYDRIDLCMTTTDAMPTSAKYYAQSGKLLRSAVFSDVADFDGTRRPSRVVMKNEVQTSRQSEMVWREFKPTTSIPASRFVVEDLGR